MRTTKAIINDIIAFFRDNESVFCDAIEELDGYNGYLGDNRYFSMEELDELYNGTEPPREPQPGLMQGRTAQIKPKNWARFTPWDSLAT